MKGQVKFRLNDVEYTFQVEERQPIETLHVAIVLGNAPTYCNECKNVENFSLDSNKDKDGNTYVNCVCRKCWAKAKLGQYKAGGFFWHKFVKYQREGGKEIPEKDINSDIEPF